MASAGGWGDSLEPLDALPAAFAEYRHSLDVPVAEERTHLINLGPAAATGLTGFRIERGRYVPTRESVDGIHPTGERHGELGTMVAAHIAKILKEQRQLTIGT